MKRTLLLLSLLAIVAISIPHVYVPRSPQSFDYVYQEVDLEAHVASPREAHARYSITVRNIQALELTSLSPPLDSRLVSPGYTLSVTRVYDSAGDLTYELPQGKPAIRVVFRKNVAPGESYRFTYEYAVRWDYDSYRWSVGWSDSKTAEKAKLKISVSDPLRIVRTYPAGFFSDDRRSAENQATNVQRCSLGIYFPPTVGRWSILALLVEFPDVRHSTGREEISRMIFRDVDAYFRDISYNQISIAGDATDWIMLPRSAASYDISRWGSPGENRRAFERDAIKTADGIVDYSRYNVVFVIAAGRGTVWAYSTGAMIRTNDDVTVEGITIQTEYTAWGTFAHEFGHQLGLPDLYDYTVAARPGVYLEAAIHVGPYCLMSRSTERPSMLAWCRLTLGWVSASKVQTAQPGDVKTVKIHHLGTCSNETVLLKIQLAAKRYYLVEVRELAGYDSVLPNGGVIITFVDELVESGNGPVRLRDANQATKSFEDAPFDLGSGKNSLFIDRERGIGVVVLQKTGDGYLIHVTKAEQAEEAKEFALESAARIEQAEMEIAKARNESRLEKLEDAVKELEQAKKALSQARYRQAMSHASNVLSILQKSEPLQPHQASQPMILIPLIVVMALAMVTVVWISRRQRTTAAA